MSTATPPDPAIAAPFDSDDEFAFEAHDMGRGAEEDQEFNEGFAMAPGDAEATVPAAKGGFHITRAPGKDAAAESTPWTVRNPRADAPREPGAWSARRSDTVEQGTGGEVRRLRQEAVTLCWTAAWRAVGCDRPRLVRRRG